MKKKISREAAGILVQKAVDVTQRIKQEMDIYIKFNKGRLEYVAKNAPEAVFYFQANRMMRRYNRRRY